MAGDKLGPKLGHNLPDVGGVGSNAGRVHSARLDNATKPLINLDEHGAIATGLLQLDPVLLPEIRKSELFETVIDSRRALRLS